MVSCLKFYYDFVVVLNLLGLQTYHQLHWLHARLISYFRW